MRKTAVSYRIRREGGQVMKVFIGVDPHKLSVTIEVVDKHERVLATGGFATDNAGYRAMRRHVASWPERVWAVEGSNGAGRPLAQRLLTDGEHVVDVPAKPLVSRSGRPVSAPSLEARADDDTCPGDTYRSDPCGSLRADRVMKGPSEGMADDARGSRCPGRLETHQR